mmetsp:Transcript_24853/g.62126  ORF Transcript_24853/g.62126 Transcript_24853/m.62126 type:complete len:256 (+) Transcript_24853:2-769(+)
MDYRVGLGEGASEEEREEAEKVPTFVYVMPTDGERVFVEETSLVARPPVPFDDLKRRLYKRLEVMGVEVEEVEEEEFCYIPMGGPRPKRDQRALAFGGAAGLVHPSTGYMLANVLNRAEPTARAIMAALDKRRVAGGGFEGMEGAAPEVWDVLWSPLRAKQRDFLVFGGEVLMRLSLTEIREFFKAFFALPTDIWKSFLTLGMLQPEQRLKFGLGMFFRTSNRVRALLMFYGVAISPGKLLSSVVPNPFSKTKKE